MQVTSATGREHTKRHTVGFRPVKQDALDLSSVNKASISSKVFGRSWKVYTKKKKVTIDTIRKSSSIQITKISNNNLLNK